MITGLFVGIGSTLGTYIVTKHFIKNLERLEVALKDKAKGELAIPEKLKEKKLPQICKDFLTYDDIFSLEARCEKLAREIRERKKKVKTR